MVAAAAWRRTSDPDLWKDLVQEGFLGLADACRDFDPSRGAFRSYAKLRIDGRILRYLDYRVDLVHVPVGSDDAVELVDEDVELIESERRDAGRTVDVEDALSILAPAAAELVRMVFLHGFTISEVSETLDVPYETCRSRLNAALQLMREWMQE